jgi:hypothetical protein
MHRLVPIRLRKTCLKSDVQKFILSKLIQNLKCVKLLKMMIYYSVILKMLVHKNVRKCFKYSKFHRTVPVLVIFLSDPDPELEVSVENMTLSAKIILLPWPQEKSASMMGTQSGSVGYKRQNWAHCFVETMRAHLTGRVLAKFRNYISRYFVTISLQYTFYAISLRRSRFKILFSLFCFAF